MPSSPSQRQQERGEPKRTDGPESGQSKPPPAEFLAQRSPDQQHRQEVWQDFQGRDRQLHIEVVTRRSLLNSDCGQRQKRRQEQSNPIPDRIHLPLEKATEEVTQSIQPSFDTSDDEGSSERSELAERCQRFRREWADAPVFRSHERKPARPC